MRLGIGLALLAVVALCGRTAAQYEPPSEKLLISASRASTWVEENQSIIQLQGPVRIELDRATLSAQSAVVWIGKADGALLGEKQAAIALLGEARLEQGDIVRSAGALMVTAQVRGTIRISAAERIAQSRRDSTLYQQAVAMRDGQPPAVGESPSPPTTSPPSTRPTGRRAPAPILFRGNVQSGTAGDGKLALIFTDGLAVSRRDADGRLLELQAQRGVLFTTLSRARDAAGMPELKTIEQAITAAYLEGDVRVVASSRNIREPEQRLLANEVYYEFTTDRAILTRAVLRTTDPGRGLPIIVRADAVRQLSMGEFRAEKAELTTSSFAVPSYSLHAERAYVRTIETGEARYGTLTRFSGEHVTLDFWHLPVFWMPVAGGEFTERGWPLRGIGIGSSKNTGFGVQTEWGLMQLLGYPPARDFDLSLSADWFADRGPAAGINGEYGGGLITQTTRQAWNFEGTFKSYFVLNDQGIDDLGKDRRNMPPEQTFRGRIRWEHQQFLPDDWQVQLSSGWVSDSNFLEEWFEREFNNDRPLETAFYAKRQRGSEALTLLATIQPNDLVTTADMLQEQFPEPGGFANNRPYEIERLPEIGYHRIGDPLGGAGSFFSDNTLSGLRNNPSRATLAEMGFRSPSPSRDAVLPGLPAVGTTGVTDNWVYRGDFRQEIDFPFMAGPMKFMPYVEGRYTGYTDSPDGGQVNRIHSATGVRINTSFWKTDEKAQSDLFDIHRVRHVIEPEVHLFTSGTTVDRSQVYIYDEAIDGIYDVSAASVALRQRWQTKRGGPGNERSVDFLTCNVSATAYANAPSQDELPPGDFRGLLFPSLPEASIPRSFVNTDALWRVSDTLAMMGDAQWNAEDGVLATASIGLASRAGERIGYYVGERYINDLNSSITTFAATYQISAKYTLIVRESFDFGQEEDVYQSIGVQRRFDRFFVTVNFYSDAANDDSGFNFMIAPEGLARGLGTEGFNQVFGQGR